MRTPLTVLIGSALYATARYHVFKDVPWSDWPTWTLNKVFALSALLLLVVAVIRGRRAAGAGSNGGLFAAGVFAALHVVLSLSLLSPAYYEKFYRDGKLTAAAGGSLLLGCVVAVAMAAGAVSRDSRPGGNRLGILAVQALLVGVHAALQGFSGWFAPWTWPGMLPPITLLSFLLGAVAVAAVLLPKRPA